MTWSHSRLEKFENCPRSYFYSYVEKPPADVLPDGVEALVGTIVHEVAERCYHHVRAKGEQPRLQQGTAYAAREFAKRFEAERPHIARKGMEQGDYAELVERCVRNLWLMRAPFDPGPVIGLERRVAGLLGGHPFQGFIDLLEILDGELVVTDYKTSKSAKTPTELKNDQQLSRYAILARRELNHTGPIRRRWIYLAPGVAREGERGTVRPRDVEARVARTVGEIEALPKEVSAFDPKPSALCRWCKFQRVCPSAKL